MAQITPSHRPSLDVTIVGSGINGLTTAYLLSFYPGIRVHIIDAESDPRIRSRSNSLSPTFGGKPGLNTVRHVTGTESLAPPAMPHWSPAEILGIARKQGLIETPDKREFKELTAHDELDRNVTSSSAHDHYHAEFNYAGLELWACLTNPILAESILHAGGISVLHKTAEAVLADLQAERDFYIANRSDTIASLWPLERLEVNVSVGDHYGITVPGMAIDIRSMALRLMGELSRRENVTFTFNKTVLEEPTNTDVTIWATNSVHSNPHQNLTGLLGFWTSVSNDETNFSFPFKLVADFPLGYLNLTPDANNRLQISGGLFRLNHTGLSAQLIMDKAREQFLKALKETLPNIQGVQALELDDVSGCVRPFANHGLPALKFEGSTIDISGGSKSGTTQAPFLAATVMNYLDLNSHDAFEATWGNLDGIQLLGTAMYSARHLEVGLGQETISR